MNHIIKADKRLRKKVLTIFLVLLGFGLITIYVVQQLFQDIQALAQNSPQEALTKMGMLFLIFFALISVSLIFFSISIIRLSLNSFRTKQFPPPKMLVIRDTKIVYGTKARQIASLGFIIAIILGFFAVLIPWQGWKIYSLLEVSIHGIDGI